MNKCLILLFITSLVYFDCSSGSFETIKQYIRNKEFDKARPVLEKTLEENNAKDKDAYFLNDEVYFYLGVVDCETGNYEKGLQEFSRSLYISSKFEGEISAAKEHYFDLIYNQGLTEYKEGDLDASLKSFKLSLGFKTDNPQSIEYVRQIKQKIAESDTTKKISDIKIQPDSSIAFYSGKGIQTTDTFSCKKKWIVEWYNDGIIFQLFLYKPNGDLVYKLADTGSPGRGSAEYPYGGNFYIKVNASGNWKINIIPAK